MKSWSGTEEELAWYRILCYCPIRTSISSRLGKWDSTRSIMPPADAMAAVAAFIASTLSTLTTAYPASVVYGGRSLISPGFSAMN